MTETLDYIERYFRGELSTDERHAFEARCENDPSFARDVSIYIATRGALKEQLIKKKKEDFKVLYDELSSTRRLAPASPLVRFLPYVTVAAACLLLFIGWIAFTAHPSPRKLASLYISDNFATLPITMAAEPDSIQLGVALFNKGNYAAAEDIFRSLSYQPETAAEATRYLGIVYLVSSRYDLALKEFDTLSEYHDLYVNHGPFYKALTLMQRDAPGDREEAKDILEEVVRKQLPGSKEASDWISRF